MCGPASGHQVKSCSIPFREEHISGNAQLPNVAAAPYLAAAAAARCAIVASASGKAR